MGIMSDIDSIIPNASAERCEESILGPSPLVLEYRLTPEGAAAILDDEPPRMKSDLAPLEYRIVIVWGQVHAYRRMANPVGELEWRGFSTVDSSGESPVAKVGELHLSSETVINIGLRRLAHLYAQPGGQPPPQSRTPNGGRIIDLGIL